MQSPKYESLPECRQYHPLSDLVTKAGYYPNISSEQLAASSELIALIESENFNFNYDDEDEFLKLLRMLRARKFNVQQAFELVKNDMDWRQQHDSVSLRFERADDVLACPALEVYKYFPAWIQGFDKQGRPVSWRQFGKFEIWNVLKWTTMENLIRFHAWETEQALRKMSDQSKATGYNVETCMVVIDAEGWGMKLATTDAFAFIKGMAVTDSDHYPERLGTMIIINAPSMLSFAWRIIQAFLDDVTKAKIKICTYPEEWQPLLQEYIDKGEIPVRYGGEAADPTPDEAILGMDPPSHLQQPRQKVVMMREKVVVSGSAGLSDALNNLDCNTDTSATSTDQSNNKAHATHKSSSHQQHHHHHNNNNINNNNSGNWLINLFQCQPPSCGACQEDEFDFKLDPTDFTHNNNSKDNLNTADISLDNDCITMAVEPGEGEEGTAGGSVTLARDSTMEDQVNQHGLELEVSLEKRYEMPAATGTCTGCSCVVM